MTDDPKDTIYIDVEDEITAVIDKVQASPKKIVALVLPKRATVFQSIVNMKLLKRTADNEKKNVVLVTSEAALLPMAGAVGLHVAKTPSSKPEIPAAPVAVAAMAAATAGAEEPHLDENATVGSLAGVADDDDAIEVDNTPAPEAEKKSGKKAKSSGKKKPKIPNFEKFRSKLFLGIAAGILLIIGLVMALVVLPKATITLKTDTSNINTNLTVTADPAATELDEEAKILPAVNKEFRKTDTEKVAATGEKDKGTKASGQVTLRLTNCSSQEVTIPAGTAVSADNLSFITQDDVTLQSIEIGGNCRNDDFPNISSETTDVVAQSAGDKYNLGSGKTFSTAGFSAVSGSNGSAMSGGTSKIVKVVTQADVDKAKDAIAKRAGDEAPDDLKEDIEKEGFRPIEETLKSGQPTVTSSPAVGAEASEVTVTSTTVFTMLGVKEDDLKKLVEESAKGQIDPSKQVILDNGLDEANIVVDSKGAGGKMTLTIQTTVVAGPDLDEDAIKAEVVGKKRGDIQTLLKQRPGVNEVEVDYSPFWVQSTPKSADKITIKLEGNAGNDADQSP